MNRRDGSNIVDLKMDDGWKYKWEDLPKYDAEGKLVQYRAIEVSISTEKGTYEVAYGDDETSGTVTAFNYTSDTEAATEETAASTTIYNKIKVGSLIARKVWDDDDNRDNLRPEDITFHLWRNGEKQPEEYDRVLDGQKTVSMDAENNYAEWERLPVCDVDGIKYEYAVTETMSGLDSGDYTETIEGAPATLTEDKTSAIKGTNKHEPLTTIMSVEKAWEGNFIYGDQPESVTVYLYATYDTGDPEELTEPEEKKAPAGQTDSEAQTGSSTQTEPAEPEHAGTGFLNHVTLSAENNWSYTWEDLPVNKHGYVGRNITYTVVEDPIPNGFEVEVTSEKLFETKGSVEVESDNFTVTNTMVTTKLDVNKSWINEEGTIGNKIKSVTFKVQRSMDDGATWTDLVNTETGEAVTLTIAKTENTASIEELPTFSADGLEYRYRAIETGYTLKAGGEFIEIEFSDDTQTSGQVGAYSCTSETSGNIEEGFVTEVENDQIKGSLIAEKTWKGGNDSDRPKSLKITLKTFAGDNEITLKDIAKSTELNKSNDWADAETWAEVPVYDESGNKIIYMLTEPEVKNHKSSYSITYNGGEIETGSGTSASTEVFTDAAVKVQFINQINPTEDNTGDEAPLAAAGGAFAAGLAGLAAVLAQKKKRRA